MNTDRLETNFLYKNTPDYLENEAFNELDIKLNGRKHSTCNRCSDCGNNGKSCGNNRPLASDKAIN